MSAEGDQAARQGRHKGPEQKIRGRRQHDSMWPLQIYGPSSDPEVLVTLRAAKSSGLATADT